MRKLIIWLVLVLGLLASVPAYYSNFGPTPPLLPGPGTAVPLGDGTKLNVLQLGPGPNLVLVHPSPGSAYDWGTLPELLVSAGRHVVVYDRKGYGFSDRRAEGDAYTFDANAKELLELLAALDLRDVTVVGWSYGGGTAIRAATLDSERIARLVLIASPGPAMEPSPPPLTTRIAMSAPVRTWVMRVPPIQDRLMRRYAKVAFSNERPPPWWVPQTIATLNLPGVSETQMAERRAMDPSVLKVEDIKVPVLLIHGGDDKLIPFSVAEDLHARLPGSELVRIDDASHMLPVTDAPQLARRIAAFTAPPKR